CTHKERGRARGRCAVHPAPAGPRARAGGDRRDPRMHRPPVPPAADAREDRGRRWTRKAPGAPESAQANREGTLIREAIMARASWFDDKAEHRLMHDTTHT